MTRRRPPGRGSTAVELPLAVTLILFPIAVVVMVIPQWPERQIVATAAAKEAASLYANGGPTAGAAAAQASVDRVAANYGLGDDLHLELTGAWCRGCTVTAHVTVDIPTVHAPMIGDIGGMSWTATSSARIEDYASTGDGR